jgi:hypothetical protein
VRRKAPTVTANSSVSSAYNRKGYFASTFLAFVDSECRFLSVSMPCYSSSHDSTLFSCSKLGRRLDEGVLRDKWVVVGDDAFVCRNNVITPYVRKELSRPQRNYNYFLSVNRQAVERTFALWKWKWGIFWRPLLIDDAHIKIVIETTCRLHNLCIDVKRGGSLDDYVFHDDIFWQRLSASRQGKVSRSPACNLDDFDFDPTYADSHTIACITGSEDTGNKRTFTFRQRILQHVIETGNQMPDVGLLVNPRRKKRMCGLRPGAPSFPSSHHNSTAVTPAVFAGCNGPVQVTQIGVLAT